MSDVSAQTHVSVPHKARQLLRGSVGRGGGAHVHSHSKNKTWVSGRSPSAAPSDGKWDRGRGGSMRSVGRGRGMHALNGGGSRSTGPSATVTEDEAEHEAEHEHEHQYLFHPAMPLSDATPKTWEELVKSREVERARAIREGKMDDPTKPKRLDEAITIVGTCQDMCPEFERYRRERENNLDKWECVVGPDGLPTKKVDHAHAVKIYERGQGDKIIPSDLRPPLVLKRTLDYLFHNLITRGGFADTQAFVRDRSRAVRNDFTIQQDTGLIAMECHERCTRFHILSLHLMYDVTTFDRALEIQQLMNSLLSLKEFYDDQRGKHQSPNELEMRIYHRLGLIRDQHERNDKPPPHIAGDPAFQLITRFRSEVQAASSPITKTSSMKVNDAAMQTFAELAGVLRARGNVVMIYLIACFLEHNFGKDTIDDLDSVKGSLTIQDIIDGNSHSEGSAENTDVDNADAAMDDYLSQEGTGEDDDLSAFVDDAEGMENIYDEGMSGSHQIDSPLPSPLKRGATQWLTENFGSAPTPPRDPTVPQSTSIPGVTSASPFGGAASQSAFSTGSPSGAGESVFGKLTGSSTAPSIFGATSSPSIFGSAPNAFGSAKNVFGGPVFGAPITTSASVFSTTKAEVPTKQLSTLSSPAPPLPSLSPRPKPIRESRSSLADAAPLSSAGDEDRVSRSEAVMTPPPPPPFTPSQSAPVLNPSAPSFSPRVVQPSLTYTPPHVTSRAGLVPLQTDSLLQNAIDPNRRIFATPIASSPSFPFPSPEKFPTASPLSINTGVAHTSNGQTRKAFAIDSPVGPPPLIRKAPISLPGTPTASFSNDAVSLEGPSTPLTSYDYSGPQVNVGSILTNVASGLSSPSSSRLSVGSLERTGASPFPGPPSSLLSSPLANGSFTSTGDAARSSSSLKLKKTQVELKVEALDFVRKHSIARKTYFKWKQRTSDATAWKDACRRSDAYKQKLHESASDNITHSSSSSKRQREVSEVVEPARARRRLKGRVSQSQAPRTDEELAERLAQNKNENERRWARGSFVRAIQEHVKSRHGSIPPNWTTWLCMNTYNDQTAIWFEQKFDVPNSGSWESEAIFTIPISTNPSVEGFPGLIVFECTPLEGIDDEIERKYHILDDCARLRDIISMLPDRRHFASSLLIVNWDSKSGTDISSDIADMIVNYVQDKTLRDAGTLSIDSDSDLDQSFLECLTALNVDLHGDLVERLSLKDIFEWFRNPWEEAAYVWLDACTLDGSFNWALFSYVLEDFSDSLNAVMKNALAAWKPSSSPLPPFPNVPFGKARDDKSVPEAIHEWLRLSVFDADYLVTNFRSADFNEDFEARSFFSHLFDLAFLYLYHNIPGSMLPRAITKAVLKRSSEAFVEALDKTQKHLRAAVKVLPQLSPKRSLDSRSASGSASRVSSSPTPSAPANGAKRARVSLTSEASAGDRSQAHEFDAPPSPTPSAAPSMADSSASTSFVTLSMLRELSRNVLKTYGSNKSSESAS